MDNVIGLEQQEQVVEIPEDLKPTQVLDLWVEVKEGRIARMKNEPFEGANASCRLSVSSQVNEDFSFTVYNKYEVNPVEGVPFCVVETLRME